MSCHVAPGHKFRGFIYIHYLSFFTDSNKRVKAWLDQTASV